MAHHRLGNNAEAVKWHTRASRYTEKALESADPRGAVSSPWNRRLTLQLLRDEAKSATQSANALGSAKRMFTRNFRSVVGEYAIDEAEVDDEIRELWEIFSRPAA